MTRTHKCWRLRPVDGSGRGLPVTRRPLTPLEYVCARFRLYVLNFREGRDFTAEFRCVRGSWQPMLIPDEFWLPRPSPSPSQGEGRGEGSHRRKEAVPC